MRTWLVVITVAAACAGVLPARAATPEPQTDEYAVRAWTTELGLLAGTGSVLAIAQDATGYLWLGTDRGLVRFDGFQFFPWGSRGEPSLPGSAVRGLISSRDGSLWMTFGDAVGVGRIRDGQLVVYSKRDGLPDGVMAVLLQDRSGTIWAGGANGLARFDGTRWKQVGLESGLPEMEVNSLYEDRSGRLWVGTYLGVFRTAPGKDAFEPFEAGSTFVQNLTEDPDGGIWVTHSQQIVRNLAGGGAPDYAPSLRLPAAGRRLLTDGHGHVWVGALGSGLLRIDTQATPRPRVEPFLPTAAKITGSVQALFEDRERNIWVGMTGGLLRLSPRLVRTDIALEGLTNEGARALTTDLAGNVWVATTHGLNRFARDSRKVYPFTQPMALHADRSGRIWVVTTEGIGRFEHGQYTSLVNVLLEQVSSITMDDDGHLWLCRRGQGLFRWNPKALNKFDRVPTQSDQPCSVVHADRQGRVWVGFGTGGVTSYDSTGSRSFGERDGLAGGSVIALLEDRGGAIWISTVSGLSRFDQDRITTVTEKNGLPSRIERWIVEDDGGYLWVGVSAGSAIIRFHRRELDKVAADPLHQIQYLPFDESDGFPPVTPYWSRPAAVRGGDGRLWFATGAGIAVIDPARVPDTRRSALPRIENAVADGRAMAPVNDAGLAPLTSTIQIDYAALSLSAATKLRFRYMLEGFSESWVYAGQRRQAFYTNLPPGEYKFRLGATNDGLWTDPEAVWAFTLQPAFYQTRWFYALCAAAGLSLVGVYWWFSLRAVKNRYAVVVAERTRVSREIHDTLLQSLGAVNLELEVVASQLGPSDPATPVALRRLRKQIGECITETRQSIWDLRSPSLERRDLVEAFRAMADSATTRDHCPDRGRRVRTPEAVLAGSAGAAAPDRSGSHQQRCPPRTSTPRSGHARIWRRLRRRPGVRRRLGIRAGRRSSDRALRPSEHEGARGPRPRPLQGDQQSGRRHDYRSHRPRRVGRIVN